MVGELAVTFYTLQTLRNDSRHCSTFLFWQKVKKTSRSASVFWLERGREQEQMKIKEDKFVGLPVSPHTWLMTERSKPHQSPDGRNGEHGRKEWWGERGQPYTFHKLWFGGLQLYIFKLQNNHSLLGNFMEKSQNSWYIGIFVLFFSSLKCEILLLTCSISKLKCWKKCFIP